VTTKYSTLTRAELVNELLEFEALEAHMAKLLGERIAEVERLSRSYSTVVLPVDPGQYLFAVGDEPFALWNLTSHGWFDGGGMRYESPLDRKPYTTWQRVVRGTK
jgi:hypothetical protein